jgi:hypothetical protein
MKGACGLEKLREHQVNVLDLFLNSTHHCNFFELYPNFGKSMIIGIIAQYKGIKVLVLEPNEGLLFTHKRKFCKLASEVEATKFSKDAGIHYCTFG